MRSNINARVDVPSEYSIGYEQDTKLACILLALYTFKGKMKLKITPGAYFFYSPWHNANMRAQKTAPQLDLCLKDRTFPYTLQ